MKGAILEMQMTRSSDEKTPTRIFRIRDLLALTTFTACAFSALAGSFLGLTIAIAFILYWTSIPLDRISIQGAIFGSLVGYCVANTIFAASFPYGTSPSTEIRCTMIGAAAGAVVLSLKSANLHKPKTHEPTIATSGDQVRS